MKRASRIALMMCLVMLVSIAIPVGFSDDKNNVGSKVKAVEIDLSMYDNELNIVEIVPYAGYSELAYFVGGSEPIDLYTVAHARESEEDRDLVDFLNSMLDNGDCYGRETIDNLLLDGKNYYITYNLEVFKRNVLLMDIDTNILKKAAVLDMLDTELKSSYLTDKQKEKINLVRKNYVLSDIEQKAYDIFNKFKVKVTTILSSNLHNMDMDKVSDSEDKEKARQALLNANLINILHRNTVGSTSRIDPFIKGDLKNSKGPIVGFKGTDEPSWSVVSYIFKRATDSVKRVPVIMPKELGDENKEKYLRDDVKEEDRYYELKDFSENKVKPYQTYIETVNGISECRYAVQGSEEFGCKNNIFKLYLLLYQLDPLYYRERFFPYIDDEGNFKAAAGPNQNPLDPAATYWYSFTFYNAKKSDNGWEPIWYDEKLNHQSAAIRVFSSGYVYNTDNSVNQKLYNKGIEIRKYNGDPLTNIQEGIIYHNQNRYSEDIYEFFIPARDYVNLSSLDILQYLLFGSVGFPKDSITVLEIEPSNSFTLSEATVRSWLLKSSNENKVTIVRKTVDELNSTYENLVANYDLIYIGNNVSAYKTTALSGKSFVANTGESGFIENGVKQTYSGNDITLSRLTDLNEYYKQGLPIIFAGSLYKNLKGYTATKTNLYQFFGSFGDVLINGQIFGEHEFSQASTATVKRLNKYMKLERPGIKSINGSLSYDSNKLEVTFQLGGASMNRKLLYKAYLYADTDGDGRVENNSYEEQTVVNNSGTISMTWNKDYPPCALYRVDIEAEGVGTPNPHKSEAYGLAIGGVKETVRILQIDANNNSTADLTDRSSAITELMRQQVDKYKFEVTRLTVDQYAALFNGNSFDNKDDIFSDQLLNYDVVVLGLAKDYPVIDNSKGAVDNLIAFIERGKSVVFTSDVLDYRSDYGNNKTREAYQTLRTLAGMSSDSTSELFTYGYLNQKGFSSTPSQGSHYNITLNSEAFVTGAVTKVNDGQVTSFPFNIEDNDLTQDTGQEKKFNALNSDRLKANYGDYRLNMKDNSVTGYYALTNTDRNGRMLYSVSQNDIEENYYLYSKGGNVWYCGIGNETLSISYEPDVELCELFVNTLVAAYTNAEASPVVEFRKSQTDNLGNSFLQIGFDVNSETENGEIIAYFVSTDENGLDMTTSLFIGDKNGPDTTKKLVTVNEVDQSTIMIKKSGIKYNTGTTKLKSGTIYAVILDKSQMGMNSNMYLYVYANNGTNVGMNRLLLDRRNDFNLR